MPPPIFSDMCSKIHLPAQAVTAHAIVGSQASSCFLVSNLNGDQQFHDVKVEECARGTGRIPHSDPKPTTIYPSDRFRPVDQGVRQNGTVRAERSLKLPPKRKRTLEDVSLCRSHAPAENSDSRECPESSKPLKRVKTGDHHSSDNSICVSDAQVYLALPQDHPRRKWAAGLPAQANPRSTFLGLQYSCQPENSVINGSGVPNEQNVNPTSLKPVLQNIDAHQQHQSSLRPHRSFGALVSSQTPDIRNQFVPFKLSTHAAAEHHTCGYDLRPTMTVDPNQPHLHDPNSFVAPPRVPENQGHHSLNTATPTSQASSQNLLQSPQVGGYQWAIGSLASAHTDTQFTFPDNDSPCGSSVIDSSQVPSPQDTALTHSHPLYFPTPRSFASGALHQKAVPYHTPHHIIQNDFAPFQLPALHTSEHHSYDSLPANPKQPCLNDTISPVSPQQISQTQSHHEYLLSDATQMLSPAAFQLNTLRDHTLHRVYTANSPTKVDTQSPSLGLRPQCQNSVDNFGMLRPLLATSLLHHDASESTRGGTYDSNSLGPPPFDSFALPVPHHTLCIQDQLAPSALAAELYGYVPQSSDLTERPYPNDLIFPVSPQSVPDYFEGRDSFDNPAQPLSSFQPDAEAGIHKDRLRIRQGIAARVISRAGTSGALLPEFVDVAFQSPCQDSIVDNLGVPPSWAGAHDAASTSLLPMSACHSHPSITSFNSYGAPIALPYLTPYSQEVAHSSERHIYDFQPTDPKLESFSNDSVLLPQISNQQSYYLLGNPAEALSASEPTTCSDRPLHQVWTTEPAQADTRPTSLSLRSQSQNSIVDRFKVPRVQDGLNSLLSVPPSLNAATHNSVSLPKTSWSSTPSKIATEYYSHDLQPSDLSQVPEHQNHQSVNTTSQARSNLRINTGTHGDHLQLHREGTTGQATHAGLQSEFTMDFQSPYQKIILDT